jgi:MFS family permease
MGRSFTLYNLRIILVLTLGSLTFGYGFSVISNTLGQPGFISYFNFENNPAHVQAITGTINGLFCAGAVFGSLTVGWMCEARGRKETMYLASIVNVVGEALEAGSIDIATFLVARFIAGWGIGMMVVLIPIYQAEICESFSPPTPCSHSLAYSTTKLSRFLGRSARYLDCLGIRYRWLGRCRNFLFD